MKHVFVFDPKAFIDQEWKIDEILDTLGQYFRKQENPVFSIQYSRYRRNAMGIIQKEVEKADPDDIIRVYAVGGDEILFDCLNAATHFSNIELAIMPYGRTPIDFLNIFGENQIENFRDILSIVSGKPLPTDVIKWGVNYALNSCYIGMNSTISQRIKNMQSSMGRKSFIVFFKISFFINSIFAAFDKQIAAREYKITVDDTDYSGHYSLIHVANGPYHNRKITGVKDASPDDGLLDVALIKSTHPLGILSSMKKYSKGKRSKSCLFFQAKKITVETGSEMWIQVDNEYIQDTSISLSVVPNAVNMVAVNNLSYPMASIPAV